MGRGISQRQREIYFFGLSSGGTSCKLRICEICASTVPQFQEFEVSLKTLGKRDIDPGWKERLQRGGALPGANAGSLGQVGHRPRDDRQHAVVPPEHTQGL